MFERFLMLFLFLLFLGGRDHIHPGNIGDNSNSACGQLIEFIDSVVAEPQSDFKSATH